MLSKALVPHLLRTVTALAVTLGPGHSAFGSIEVIVRFFRSIPRTKVHVGGDDGTPVSMLFEDRIGPGENVVRCVAFHVQKHELQFARFKQLSAVGVVSRNFCRAVRIFKTTQVPIEFLET